MDALSGAGAKGGRKTAKRPRKSPKSAGAKPRRKDAPVAARETKKDEGRCRAEIVTSPELAACRVINATSKSPGSAETFDVLAMTDLLREQAEAANRGDLKYAESMLINQATALQSLFARLAERGMGCDRVTGFESNMKMALRAQSQCRATLETLSAIKNPPVVYARQANVTSGPQQINNGLPARARARKNENAQNKQSGDENELLPHTRAPSLAGGDDSTLETLGEIDRAKVGRR